MKKVQNDVKSKTTRDHDEMPSAFPLEYIQSDTTLKILTKKHTIQTHSTPQKHQSVNYTAVLTESNVNT